MSKIKENELTLYKNIFCQEKALEMSLKICKDDQILYIADKNAFVRAITTCNKFVIIIKQSSFIIKNL